MITAIVAYNSKFVIGKDGKVPWRIPEEIRHFKETTMGNVCIMGRSTFESIPPIYRPLPGRTNIIMTHSTDMDGLIGVNVAHNMQEAVDRSIHLDPGKEIFVIGGEQIYWLALTMGLVGKVIASEVKGHDVEGDRFFPNLAAWKWKPEVVKEMPEFNVVVWTP